MSDIRHDWKLDEVMEIYNRPLIDLIFEAATVHRSHHDPKAVQVSTLLSVKTGGCGEDCAYCPQSARYHAKIEANELLTVDQVRTAAANAKESGSSRLCMGAAWRNVRDNEEFETVLEMVRAVYDMGMEVCCTLGMVTEQQAKRLAAAGLHAYNHNIDTSEEYYKKIISTRGFEDRLKTLENVRKAKLTVCSGGIIGMGESAADRCGMLLALSNLNPHPESVPINGLVAVEGTPLEDQKVVPIWDMVRMIATARIVLPDTTVRLSAGRTQMTDEGQALCFLAGAGSIFAGDRLLTTPNPDFNDDMKLFHALGMAPCAPFKKGDRPVLESRAVDSIPVASEKVKWSRPGHDIERNLKAAEKARSISH